MSLPALLGPALEAARRSLRDLDADQVPGDLRRVAAHSGRLTPPLARSLLRALERYEWLRQKALEAWPEADADAGGREGAATLFLERPEGWELRVIETAIVEGADAASDAGDRKEVEHDKLRDERDRLRARIKQEKRAAADREQQLRSEIEELRRERRGAAAAEAKARGGDREETNRLRGLLSTLETALEEEERTVGRLREELRSERRARAAAESRVAEAALRPSWGSEDPVELAARIDEMSLMARPPSLPEDVGVPGDPDEAGAFGLPAGVGPDSAEAVAWLVRHREPTTLLVDGYNVAFALAGAGSPVEARRRLEPILEQVGRVGAGRLRVVVIYDSSDDPAPSRRFGQAIDVRFAAGDTTADDEIAALAAELEGRLVVVSSDREVRETAERHGALALWSEALVDWARRR